jgi:hypothetical protein
MESLRTIWQDIQLDLKQLSDDLEISDAQGLFWVLIAADRLRMQHIEKRSSGAFLRTFVVTVAADPTFTQRRRMELPKSIYDFDGDRGIESITYFDATATRPEFQRVTFSRTTPARSRTRNMSEYQRAKSSHPYFWREEEWIYLDGIGAAVTQVEVKLFCTLPTIREVDAEALADEPFNFPSELLYVLKRHVLEYGRFSLSIPGQELVNDGSNRNQGQTLGKPEKTTSVNDAMVRSDAQ